MPLLQDAGSLWGSREEGLVYPGRPWRSEVESRKGGPRCGEEPGGEQRAGLRPPGPSGLELSAPHF